jgi:hypothetical protein
LQSFSVSFYFLLFVITHFFLKDKVTVAQGGVSKAVSSVKEKTAIVTDEKAKLFFIVKTAK